VKRRSIIRKIISSLLIVSVLIGGSGLTVVIHTCSSCGISIDTLLLETLATSNNSCCGSSGSGCATDTSKSMDSGCCTFITEKLKLTNFIHTAKISYSPIAVLNPFYSLHSTPELKESSAQPVFVHNKHGGEEVCISNCQLLI
jgi:hypothetical protein